jgi:zinc transport system substrate-binding protein
MSGERRGAVKKRILVGCLAGVLLLFARGVRGEEGRIKVFVSILPQADFVERVGGTHVDVEVLVGPGKSPATYEPTSKQMARLERAQVYFRIGTPFEKGFLGKLQKRQPSLPIVDLRDGVTLRYFQRGGEREVPDPHIWLDPKRVKVQTSTICEALCRLAPQSSARFRENLAAFHDDLDRLDRQIADLLAPLQGRTFYVFHPAFGYFGESYGLKQVAVEMEGKSPSARQLAALIEQARADGVKVLFVQPQYSKMEAQAVADAIDGVVVPINPLPREYLKEMEQLAAALRMGLRRGNE